MLPEGMSTGHDLTFERMPNVFNDSNLKNVVLQLCKFDLDLNAGYLFYSLVEDVFDETVVRRWLPIVESNNILKVPVEGKAQAM